MSSGTAALHLGVRALGWGAGRRGRHDARSASSRRPTACSTRTSRRSSATSTRVTLNIDPAGRRGGLRRRGPPGCCPVHIFGYPADMDGARARSRPSAGSGIVEDACEALGAVDADGVKVGARGNPAAFAFYANKQLATGEGGMLDRGRPRVCGCGPAASATRAAATTWTGSGTTGSASTTGSPTSRRRSAWRSSSALDDLLARPRAGSRPSTPSA